MRRSPAHARDLDLGAPRRGAAAARRPPARRCRGCRRSCRGCGSAASRLCATPRPAPAAPRATRALHRLGVGEPGAEDERAVLARRSRAAPPTSLRLISAGGRERSKLSSTSTSVPPWTKRASGSSALRRSASSRRVRGEDVHPAYRSSRTYGTPSAPGAPSRRLRDPGRDDHEHDDRHHVRQRLEQLGRDRDARAPGA